MDDNRGIRSDENDENQTTGTTPTQRPTAVPATKTSWYTWKGGRRRRQLVRWLRTMSLGAMGCLLVLYLPTFEMLGVVHPKSTFDQEIHQITMEEYEPDARMTNQSQSSPKVLPPCDELMRTPGSPFQDGPFLTSLNTSIRWSRRDDGSRRLDLTDICRLKRYTAREAQQCLTSTHISMIGDSVTRYQYVSLAYFMEHGTFPQRFGISSPQSSCLPRANEMQLNTSCVPINQRNICMQVDWTKKIPKECERDGWMYYLSELGGGTNGSIMRGRMECPCGRSSRVKESAENELYTHRDRKTVLSYIRELGWGDPNPPRGFWFSGCSESGTCRLTVKEVKQRINHSKAGDFDWKQSMPEAIDINGVLRKVLPKPDIAIYNRGIWGILKEERAQRIMPALYDWVGGEQGGRCFFKSTTFFPRSLKNDHLGKELRQIAPHVYQAGCSYLDYAYLTNGFSAFNDERKMVFFDSVHFMPWVYEELNQVLLNVLCNVKSM